MILSRVLDSIWVLLAGGGLLAQWYLQREFKRDLVIADGLEPSWGLMHRMVHMHLSRTRMHLLINWLALGIGIAAWLPLPRLFGLLVAAGLIGILLTLTASAWNDVRQKRALLDPHGAYPIRQ